VPAGLLSSLYPTLARPNCCSRSSTTRSDSAGCERRAASRQRRPRAEIRSPTTGLRSPGTVPGSTTPGVSHDVAQVDCDRAAVVLAVLLVGGAVLVIRDAFFKPKDDNRLLHDGHGAHPGRPGRVSGVKVGGSRRSARWHPDQE